MKPSVSIIVPAYQEAGNITDALAGVLRAASSLFLVGYEVIVVDDGSTDSTAEQARIWAEYRPHVRVISHETNLGLRAAYETGLKFAQYEYATWVPGDGEMASESIAEILRAVGTADIVVPYHGTPWNRPWFRRLLTWGSTQQLNVLLGRDLRYFQGTVVYPTALARRLPRTESGFFFAAEMLSWALEEGCTYVEVPLVHRERRHGVSKAVGLKAIWRAQMLILRLAFRIHAERMALIAKGMLIG